MSEAAVLYDKHGAVAVITLNRPQRLNAYDVHMRDGLFAALGAVRDDPEVRGLVLCGNGPAFCSGGDLNEFGSAPSPVVARQVRWQRDVAGLLYHLPKVTVAAVHGYAIGGGFELASLCDLCVAAEDAVFGYPETGLGMIPGVVGTQTAPRLLGLGRALDLVLTGKRISAREAEKLGFVARVTMPSDLRTVAVALVAEIARIPARMVAYLKRAVTDGLDMALPSGLDLERRLWRLSSTSRAGTLSS